MFAEILQSLVSSACHVMTDNNSTKDLQSTLLLPLLHREGSQVPVSVCPGYCNREEAPWGRYRTFSVLSLSVVSNSAAPRTVAHQAPLSMEFPKQEYWSEVPFLTPGHHQTHISYVSCIVRWILYHSTPWKALGSLL